MNLEEADNGAQFNGRVFPIIGALERAIDEIDLTLASGSDIVLDFNACTFIKVEAVEWLEEVMLRSQSSGARVSFVNLRPHVYKVFKVAHVDSLLKACAGSASIKTNPSC